MSEQRLTADSNVDFEEFTEILYLLVRDVYGEDVTFSEEFPSNSDPEKQPTPYIAYSVERRIVTENRGIKQNAYAHYRDPDNEGEIITPLRKWFDYTVHFSIFSATNRQSREWAEEFEDMIERYKGFIKKQGVSEILFIEEIRDVISSNYRQDLSMRTLKYMVRIERITEIKSVELSRIEASVKTDENSEDREYYLLAEKKKQEEEKFNRVLTGSENFLKLYEQTNHSFQKKEEQ